MYLGRLIFQARPYCYSPHQRCFVYFQHIRLNVVAKSASAAATPTTRLPAKSSTGERQGRAQNPVSDGDDLDIGEKGKSDGGGIGADEDDMFLAAIRKDKQVLAEARKYHKGGTKGVSQP